MSHHLFRGNATNLRETAELILWAAIAVIAEAAYTAACGIAYILRRHTTPWPRGSA